MKKIPALIRIDRVNHVPTNELNPDVVNLLSENMVATRKRDGQPVKFLGGDHQDVNNWVTRRAVNPGKAAPQGFILEQHDATTGKSFGWEPVTQSSVIKPFRAALVSLVAVPTVGSTWELCGPKIQGNPENLATAMLFAHGTEVVDVPNLAGIDDSDVHSVLTGLARHWREQDMEGIVFWMDGAPVVKVRVKDFVLD